MDLESWNEGVPGRPWAIALVWVFFVAVVGCMAYDVFTGLQDAPSGPARAASVRADGARCCD